VNDEELEEYQKQDDRFSEKTVNKISSYTDEDDMMLDILEIAKEYDVLPLPGKYYTFVYKAKTPRIQYDEYPLIACVGVYKWGFRGLNYHWGDFRNYTWEEVIGYTHVIYPTELDTLRSIPYQKFKLNI